MATGKYLSLEEARNNGQLERFTKEHQSTGDKLLFDGLLDTMLETPKTGKKTPSESEPKK